MDIFAAHTKFTEMRKKIKERFKQAAKVLYQAACRIHCGQIRNNLEGVLLADDL